MYLVKIHRKGIPEIPQKYSEKLRVGGHGNHQAIKGGWSQRRYTITLLRLVPD